MVTFPAQHGILFSIIEASGKLAARGVVGIADHAVTRAEHHRLTFPIQVGDGLLALVRIQGIGHGGVLLPAVDGVALGVYPEGTGSQLVLVIGV